MVKKIAKIILGNILTLSLLIAAGYFAAPVTNDPVWGINFSPSHARGLGFEPKQLFTQMLDELQVKYVRLPAYWSDIEAQQGQYDFSEIDELLTIAKERDVQIILAVGRKLPRWPECHVPEWWETLDGQQKVEATFNKVRNTVTHFQTYDNIFAWQLENEPFFDYGEDCPVSERELYRQQLAIIHELDPRPVIGTDSGEKGAWLPTAWTGINIFGSTMYREVYLDKERRYTTYPLPAWTYRVKAGWVRMFSGANRAFGVELQAEPWFAGTGPVQTPYEEHKRLMNSDILLENIEYAKRSGLEQHYFWGAEWWYWLAKTHNDNSLIETVKPIFRNN